MSTWSKDLHYSSAYSFLDWVMRLLKRKHIFNFLSKEQMHCKSKGKDWIHGRVWIYLEMEGRFCNQTDKIQANQMNLMVQITFHILANGLQKAHSCFKAKVSISVVMAENNTLVSDGEQAFNVNLETCHGEDVQD